MVRLCLMVMFINMTACAADVLLPLERLKSLPVLVRYDAYTFYDSTHSLFSTNTHHLSQENGYKLLFKGLIFGQTFKIVTNTDKLLNMAIRKLITKKEFQETRQHYKAILEVQQYPHVNKKGHRHYQHISRKAERDDFHQNFGSILDQLYNEGNVYALFIRGFLEYDDALDSGNDTANALEKITCTAEQLCFHALSFCKYGLNDSNKYKTLINKISEGNPGYHTPYFDELEFIVELMQKPHLFRKVNSNKITPSTLPNINVLKKIKQSANLFSSESIFTRNYSFQEDSYYGNIFSELLTMATQVQIEKPALGKWGQTAVILCPIISVLGGMVGVYNGQTSAILTTFSALPTIIYGFQTQLARPMISKISNKQLEDDIDLISIYFTLKANRSFTEDKRRANRVFNFCFSYNNFNQIYQLMTGTLPNLSQMILEIEREEA